MSIAAHDPVTPVGVTVTFLRMEHPPADPPPPFPAGASVGRDQVTPLRNRREGDLPRWRSNDP